VYVFLKDNALLQMKVTHNQLFAALLLLSLSSCLNKALVKTDAPDLSAIRLPKGFRIELYADKVKNARSMVMGDKGTLFVGTRSEGNLYAISDLNGDFRADTVRLLAKGMHMPNGVAFRNGALYVAEVGKIWRYDSIESRLDQLPAPVLLNDSLPNDDWHGWKYIAFGPDDKLYIPVGAPCNVCEKEDPRYASMMRMNPDGSGLEIYAKGIRNSVGFSWHPDTKELWFTENGRDLMGDDVPNDELNRAPQAGMHFGFPYCHAGQFPDPRYGEGHTCDEYTAPVQRLAPHTAALGMKFYTGAMFPAEYQQKILIAEHGSWNRSTPIGYRIMVVTLKGNEAVSYEPFAEGWLHDGKAWGRPVDILQLADGSLLVSDDFANAIYRISYRP
jgi:glucose/arabinose dehydrogenase